MNILEQVKKTISKITSVPPEIYLLSNKNIKVVFVMVIPTEEEVTKIETALSQFGETSLNDCRECNFLSWIIIR